MSKEFIPYEQALEMKELGHDVLYSGEYFEMDGEKYIIDDKDANDGWWLEHAEELNVNAVLYQQAFRWFREKHNLFSSVSVDQTMEPKFCYSLSKYADPYDWAILVFNSELYYTYEEAELACLKKLIEIVKTNNL